MCGIQLKALTHSSPQCLSTDLSRQMSLTQVYRKKYMPHYNIKKRKEFINEEGYH
jgi:hypothetical protein